MTDKNYRTLITFALAFFITGSIIAQNKINLMSGKTLEGTNIKIDDEFVHYDFTIKDKVSQNQIEIYRIFSIIDENNVEQLIYVQDSTHGRHYSVDEMRIFISGEQEAYAVFKSPVTTVVTGVVGVANGLVFNSYPILALPGAFLTAFVGAVIPAKIKIKTEDHKKLLKEPAYHDGYRRVAKSKKLKNGMFGSVVGTAVGIATGILFL